MRLPSPQFSWPKLPSPGFLRPRIFYPPLLAAAPVILLYAQNAGILPVESVARPLLASMAAACAIWLLFGIAMRSAAKGAAAAAVLVVAIVGYSTVASKIPLNAGPLRQEAYAALAVLLAILAGLRTRPVARGESIGGGTQAMNVFATVLLVLALARGAQGWRAAQGNESGQATLGGRSADRPDIFYIVLDGFGRQDALKAKEGFDDRFFVDGLRSLGFFVADRSRANYVQTELSLSSSLNMDHLRTLLPHLAASTLDRGAFDQLIYSNAAAKTLEARGYRFITVTTGFPAVKFPAANSGYEPSGGLSLLETTLIGLTPLGEDSGVSESMFIVRRRWLAEAFVALDSLAGDAGQPRFVFAHILAPHPPFVIGAQGEPIRPTQNFSYYDGSDYMEHGGTRTEYRTKYAAQAEWVARRTLATVARIVSASKRPPIIIVQGDHGPKSGLVQNSLNDTDLAECVPNLNAYFVPPEVRAKLDPGITPVNSFRVVLGTLFGLDLPRRPDRSYFSPFSKPMELTDVTDRVPDVVR